MSSNETQTTLSIDWDTLHRDCLALAERLRALRPVKGVIAVARGGLVPAAVVARALDARVVETVCIASYRQRVRGDAAVLKAIAGAGDGAGWVVVDDLTDSGITARAVRDMLPKAHIATVYGKPKGLPDVDTCMVEVDQDVWLIFPWEVAEED